MPKTVLSVDAETFRKQFNGMKGMHGMSNDAIGVVAHESGVTIGNWLKDPGMFRFGAAQRLAKKWKCRFVIDSKGFHIEGVQI